MITVWLMPLLISFLQPDDKDDFFAAARRGVTAVVKALLDKGMDVNTKNDYGATAIIYATEKGHLETMKLLIKRKADLDLSDTFYKANALNWAMMSDRQKPLRCCFNLVPKGRMTHSLPLFV